MLALDNKSIVVSGLPDNAYTSYLMVNGIFKQSGVGNASYYIPAEWIHCGKNTVSLADVNRMVVETIVVNIDEIEITETGGILTFYPEIQSLEISVNSKLTEAGNLLQTYNLKENSYIINGNNKIIATDTVYGVSGTYTYDSKAKNLLDLEEIAAFYTYQLDTMSEDTENDIYIYNVPYVVDTVTNLGTSKLREKAVSNKKPQNIMASLNMTSGTVTGDTDLDMYNYTLQYFFIATTETAKSLKERIDVLTYNNQGKAIPVGIEGYTSIANYSLATMGAPFFENGEERVAIAWYISIDFTKLGVYADDVTWELKIGDLDYLPMNAFSIALATTYGVNPVQTNESTNTKADTTNRSMAWNVSIPYTRSTLTSAIYKDYVMPESGDEKAFSEVIYLRYSEESFSRVYKVIMSNVTTTHEIGKIVGISFDLTEAI